VKLPPLIVATMRLLRVEDFRPFRSYWPTSDA